MRPGGLQTWRLSRSRVQCRFNDESRVFLGPLKVRVLVTRSLSATGVAGALEAEAAPRPGSPASCDRGQLAERPCWNAACCRLGSGDAKTSAWLSFFLVRAFPSPPIRHSLHLCVPVGRPPISPSAVPLPVVSRRSPATAPLRSLQFGTLPGRLWFILHFAVQIGLRTQPLKRGVG